LNYDNSLVVTITATCNLWAPSSGDHSFTCGTIYLPPHRVEISQIEQQEEEVRPTCVVYANEAFVWEANLQKI